MGDNTFRNIALKTTGLLLIANIIIGGIGMTIGGPELLFIAGLLSTYASVYILLGGAESVALHAVNDRIQQPPASTTTENIEPTAVLNRC